MFVKKEDTLAVRDLIVNKKRDIMRMDNKGWKIIQKHKTGLKMLGIMKKMLQLPDNENYISNIKIITPLKEHERTIIKTKINIKKRKSQEKISQFFKISNHKMIRLNYLNGTLQVFQ